MRSQVLIEDLDVSCCVATNRYQQGLHKTLQNMKYLCLELIIQRKTTSAENQVCVFTASSRETLLSSLFSSLCQLQGGASSKCILTLGRMTNTPPYSPCPTFTFSFRLLMVEGPIQASQLCSGPQNCLICEFPPSHCCWPAVSAVAALLVGKTAGWEMQRTSACTRVSVETVWNSLLHVSVRGAPLLSVYCANKRLRKRPAGRTSKGLFILVFSGAFLSNDRLKVTVCKLKWDREK